jgi:hypothetical protein
MPAAESAPTPTRQLAFFLAKFDPKIAKQARAALASLRRQVPGALELVYDNYNALAIGFSPTEKASDVVVSIALYPRWVTLFFLKGANLPDPKGVLRGSGKIVRHVVLTDGTVIESAPIKALIRRAVRNSAATFGGRAARRLVIKSVSAKQRPRRRG